MRAPKRQHAHAFITNARVTAGNKRCLAAQIQPPGHLLGSGFGTEGADRQVSVDAQAMLAATGSHQRTGRRYCGCPLQKLSSFHIQIR